MKTLVLTVSLPDDVLLDDLNRLGNRLFAAAQEQLRDTPYELIEIERYLAGEPARLAQR